MLEKNRFGGPKSNQMNSAELLEALGENTNEESKQRAPSDTFIRIRGHFQVMQTPMPLSPSQQPYGFQVLGHTDTAKLKAIVLTQKPPILLKANAFPAFFLQKTPSPTGDGCGKVGPQPGGHLALSAQRRGESSGRAESLSQLPPGYRVLL